ncbi:MAG: AmmeMemoRadiSam system radical SAM enzyme [Candidatus Omnitrophica bacterium 4484_70.1]|nr:MAG: AmmeMemoRadiSam system radical SAM enzyme [Candidatus Omnitrophica bacterium 4484_70.1]
MKEALLYVKSENKKVKCNLCNHFCVIKEGGRGRCGVRINQEGTLYTLSYENLIAKNIDPIEKKPLFHFFPGSLAYSIACIGCNFGCPFCQNWEISQIKEAEKLGIKGTFLPPQNIVEEAFHYGCKSISYTYTEPTVFFELAYECAKLAKRRGLYNNFVTNGFMSKEAIRLISPYLDAANVDLKAFSEDFYKKYCGASLKPILENIELMKELGIWVEITTLLIPGLNDSDEELGKIVSFIASLSPDIPWHVNRFHPDYRFYESRATPLSVLEKAYRIGKRKGLRYIYIGNIFTDYGENTYCPQCGKIVIKRVGFSVKENNLIQGRCKFCGEKLAGVYE